MLKTTLSVVAITVLGMSTLYAEAKLQTKTPIVLVNDTANSAVKNIGVGARVSTHVNTTIHTDVRTTNKPTLSVKKYDDTIVHTKALKNHYAIGEKIKIELELKRDAYIYFWTISHDGKGYLILPNDFNVVKKYQAKKSIIPEKTALYDFASDRAGVEEVFVLATSKPISFNQFSKIFNTKSGLIPTASQSNISIFIQKDIFAIAKQEKFQYDMQSFLIQIHQTPPTLDMYPQIQTSFELSTSVRIYR